MSEFSLASTADKKKTHLSSLLLSDFMLFCSFVLSHPLYFSYFIFFSPYLFKIFSFLSPLFVTTALLVLAFCTLNPSFVNHAAGSCHLDLPESMVSFLLTTAKVDDKSDGFGCMEELEAYKIVFETSTALEIREYPDEVLEMGSKGDCLQAVEASVDQGLSFENKGLGVPETLTSSTLDEKPAEITRPETNNQVKAAVKIFEEFSQDGVENLSSKKTEKEVKSLSVDSNKDEEQKEEFMIRRGSKAMGNKISDPNKVNADDHGGKHAAKAMVNSQRVKANWIPESDGYNYNSKVTDNYQTMGYSSLGKLGSMRKEKEWERTLACKLFEERRQSSNVDGGEGMDLLWETYETNSNKVPMKSSSKKGKKGGHVYYDHHDEEESDGQFCCLQALKFSSGKMNLGMGRPNLVKISKVLKGIGWLHHVSSRHGKKGYH